MPQIAFDRFYRYAELTDLLHAFAREHPDLVTIESIGKSHEGRDIWVLTVTNGATGPASEKPAFWVDGNIHATEVAASAASLYFLHTLVTQYGNDADVTRALDTRAFYVCPRINPDGAEWALADKPKWVRSSTRPYPFDEEDVEGLTVEDIDGDGRILQMRIADPNGIWKAHPQEPRLMVRRDPTEVGRHVLPRHAGRPLRRLRRLHAEDQAAPRRGSTSTAISRRAGGRNSSSSAPVRIRRRSRRFARSSTSSCVIRTSPAARRSTRGAACCCGRSSTCPTTRWTPRTCGSTRRRGARAPSSPAIRPSPSITSSAITRSR